MLRRLRAIFISAMTWAIFWIVPGIAFGFWEKAYWHMPLNMNFVGLLVRSIMMASFAGFVGGGIFAAALSAAERNRSIAELSRKRAALFGAIGRALVPLAFAVPMSAALWGKLLVIGGTALYGAFTASGALAAAQQAEATALPGSRSALPEESRR